MNNVLSLIIALLLWLPLPAAAQDGRAVLESSAKALGADTVKTIQYQASGVNFAVGQSAAPGTPWPRFNIPSFTRLINYETASLREEQVRSRAEMPPRGGGIPSVGEARQIQVVSGDFAWNVAGETAAPAPLALIERQLQLWSTPHGLVKAALAANATVQGRTIAFTVPGRYRVKATLDDRGLVTRVDAVLSSPVVGDMPVEVSYAEYRDFNGVKFPTRVQQSIGGFPAADLTVSDVRPNVAADIAVPDSIRQATMPYARVVSEQAADGVWYVAGGTHHSVVIEMKDHVLVVEGPLNDERATAVIAEARRLVPGKPIRYVINSHHHFDHAGGLRAFAAEGIPVITHESSRAFFETALMAPATMTPDRQQGARRQVAVEGVRDKRVLTDGTRTVEIHHLASSTHATDMLMVYLPKERILIEADVFTPGPPNAPVPAILNPLSVDLADSITRLGLGVDRLLPLHGRIVPVAELTRAIGRSN
ncbi:MAG TPA: MBL fold metallo-hydrolase [Candidatus Dormibacteraeota bacterium]|nr:MBL fold metallo-hydrolase [Candidatus Dormibacteraeota bacterium]